MLTTTVTLIVEQPTPTVYARPFLRPSFKFLPGAAAREQHLDVVIMCAGFRVRDALAMGGGGVDVRCHGGKIKSNLGVVSRLRSGRAGRSIARQL
jgi:hypothetical protein